MKVFLFSVGLLMSTACFSQKDINLNLVHNYNGASFSYGTNYTTSDGDAVLFDRVQYYLSGIELTHDGGQSLPLADPYVLGSGNVSNYSLGNQMVSTVEGLSFDLGVDVTANGQGLSSWPANHPLAAQSPSMDWGWPAGYFFFVIDGMVDDSGDGVPNRPFSMRGLGDALLRNVTPFTGLNNSDATITLTVDVNIADWILGIDLAQVGSDHSGSPINVKVADNTNDETVFTMDPLASIDELWTKESKIYANYELPYAPTIFYNLATSDRVDIAVFDMTGKRIMESKNEPFEGSYFIREELKTGSYFIVFSNGEIEENFRFVVKQ